jgi:Cu2+-containing amine oxidase
MTPGTDIMEVLVATAAGAHPLHPLSASEITDAVSILRAD